MGGKVIRRLFVCTTVLGCGLLLVTGRVMASGPFPNSYATHNSYTYDPTVGKAGTATITVTFSGAMQVNPGIPCQTPHTPAVRIKMPNGNYTPYVYGPATQACSSMGWSHTFTFDLDSIGCTNDLLFGGECVFESQGSIACPMMGAFWWVKWQDIQFEVAITYSWVSALVKSNGWHPEAFYCSNDSSPPDWPGPFEASPNTKSGEYVGAEEMYREVNPGQSFTGVKWLSSFSYISQPYIYPTDNPPPACTNYDKGYKSGQNVFWPLPPLF